MKKYFLIIKVKILKMQLKYLYFKLLLARIRVYGFVVGCIKCNVNPVQFVLFLLLLGVFIFGSILRPVAIPCYGVIVAIALPIITVNEIMSSKRK